MKSLQLTLATIAMTAAATAALAATKTKTPSEKTPESIECSKQADAKFAR